MNISKRQKFLSFFLLAGASYAWAAPAGTKCGDLLNMQIDNATISEAVDVPAGQPVSVGGLYGPAVQVTSLPAHCLVHGEVNHHKGADGKDYGDKFELRMPASWQGRFLYMGGGGLDGILNPAIGLQGPVAKADSKSALSIGYAVVIYRWGTSRRRQGTGRIIRIRS